MNKDEVEITKRQLNLVYGKFATNPNVIPKTLFIDKDDGILRLYRVAYVDTDSIHLVGIQVPDAIKDIIDEILYCAFLDGSITLDDFKELSTYADKLTRYLRECL